MVQETENFESNKTEDSNSQKTVNYSKVYFKKIKELPTLSTEEEKELAERIQQGKSAQNELQTLQSNGKSIPNEKKSELDKQIAEGLAAREHFINANMRLVLDIAKKHTTNQKLLEELVTEGSLALIESVDKFEPSHNYKFSTYAVPKINGAILTALQAASGLKKNEYWELNKLQKKESVLAQELLHQPTTSQLSESLQWKPEKAEELLFLSKAKNVQSLDAPVDDEGESSLSDFLPNETATPLDCLLSQEQKKAFEILATPREKKIFAFYQKTFSSEYMAAVKMKMPEKKLEAVATSKTLEKTASEFNLSEERVKQILYSAIAKHNMEDLSLDKSLHDIALTEKDSSEMPSVDAAALTETNFTEWAECTVTSLENALYTHKDFETFLERMEAAENASARNGQQARLHNARVRLCHMFEACDIDAPASTQPYADFRELFESKKHLISKDVDTAFQERFIPLLLEQFSNFHSPQDYMKRLVNHLSTAQEKATGDSLRLKILKRFLYKGYSCYGYVGAPLPTANPIYKYASEKLQTETKILKKCPIEELLPILKDTDGDSVFDKLGTESLLKTANDLASGVFRQKGGTKELLYQFAVLYNMTFYPYDEEKGTENPWIDVEEKLFRDYYCNNFVRYLTETYSDPKNATNFEAEPSGQGINVKNYIEVIYLYYLHQRQYNAVDKLNKIQATIKQVNDAVDEQIKQTGSYQPPNEVPQYTYYARTLISQVMKKEEDELADFLIKNYNCESQKNEPRFQRENAQHSAYIQFIDIAEILKSKSDKEKQSMLKYGLWFTDLEWLAENWKKKNDGSLLSEQAQFLLLLEKIDTYLKETLKAILDDKIKENIESSKNSRPISRGAIITAYYYWYISDYTNQVNQSRTLSDVLLDFETEVNCYLDDSYYQPFSRKNIFDVLVAFSAYARLTV